MSGKRNRREFVKLAAGSLAGLGLVPSLIAGRRVGTSPPAAGAPRGTPHPEVPPENSPAPRRDDGLPPRTVGLRSLGGDFRFDPPGLRLAPGDALTWLNMGDFHTSTAFHPANDGLLADGVPLRIPAGAEPWHSGMLGLTEGTEFSHTFRVPGVHDYFCQPHYGFGMVGRIVVTEGRGDAPAARPLSELNEASRRVMPTVDAVIGAPGRAYQWAARINGLLLLTAHAEPVDEPMSRMVAAIGSDAALGDLLGRAGASGDFDAALSRLREAVRSAAGYETLLARADAAKASLRAAIPDSG